jgi:hypothetical protein
VTHCGGGVYTAPRPSTTAACVRVQSSDAFTWAMESDPRLLSTVVAVFRIAPVGSRFGAQLFSSSRLGALLGREIAHSSGPLRTTALRDSSISSHPNKAGGQAKGRRCITFAYIYFSESVLPSPGWKISWSGWVSPFTAVRFRGAPAPHLAYPLSEAGERRDAFLDSVACRPDRYRGGPFANE